MHRQAIIKAVFGVAITFERVFTQRDRALYLLFITLDAEASVLKQE